MVRLRRQRRGRRQIAGSRAGGGLAFLSKREGARRRGGALALIGQNFAAREAWRDALNADALSPQGGGNADLQQDLRRLARKARLPRARNTRSTINRPMRAPASSFPKTFCAAEPILPPSSRWPARPRRPFRRTTSRFASRTSGMASITRCAAPGLPSHVGEDLTHPLNYDLYIRDR